MFFLPLYFFFCTANVNPLVTISCVKFFNSLSLSFYLFLLHLFCLPPLSGQDSASQFLVPGILIAVGMLLLVVFVFVAAYCIR